MCAHDIILVLFSVALTDLVEVLKMHGSQKQVLHICSVTQDRHRIGLIFTSSYNKH